MLEAGEGKPLLKFAALWALLLSLVAVTMSTRMIVASEETPKVSVRIQSDAPLQISSPVVNTAAGPREPRIDYHVTNVSGKPVNAYAIHHVVLHGNQSSEGVVLRNTASADSLLQAGHMESAVLEGVVYTYPVQSIELILDFVEFADGSAWGTDKFKSAERLSGQRAGAQAEAERLLTIAKEKGEDAVMQSIGPGSTYLSPPPGHTSEWISGFREGINFKRSRLKRAHSKPGASIEEELRRPFDAVAGRGRK